MTGVRWGGSVHLLVEPHIPCQGTNETENWVSCCRAGEMTEPRLSSGNCMGCIADGATYVCR
jgi:hypothetical protein